MSLNLINPKNNLPLHSVRGQMLVDMQGNFFPIVNGVPRIAHLNNYATNFGVQWNKFDKTQLDRDGDGLVLSRKRFFVETGWAAHDLNKKDILEVGSGAGRFSKVLLEHTNAQLYSIDYSDAVTANFKNNGEIAPDRFHLYQASIYEIPFLDNSFDKVFCLGVLQHTPNFQLSVQSLIRKAKPGGEIVVDFYPIKGWWTMVHAKYILRPLTKRLTHDMLFNLINKNIDWLINVSKLFNKIGLSILTRFLPLVDLRTIPLNLLTEAQLREWVILDTFDMFSPEHDHPHRIEAVAEMFRRCGAKVTFSGFIEYEPGLKAAVVRGIKE